MAWAVTKQTNLGDFYPAGDYIGWKESVYAYFFNEMSDEEKRAMRPDMALDYHEFARKLSGDYGPLLPANCPSEYRMEKRYSSLASLLHLTNRLRAVDQALRELIEELEPGVHQFWPMQLTQPNGEIYPGQYYGMIIGHFMDGFLPEQSDASKLHYRENYGYIYSALTKKDYAGLAMSAAAIGSTHLWREKRLRDSNIYISDALQAGIVARGLRVPKQFKLMVV